MNVEIPNLKSFGRYIVSVIACQNFTQELKDYAKAFKTNTNTRKKKDLVSYLSFFPISKYCSKPGLITFRSLPDKSLDQIPETSLLIEADTGYFQWSPPLKPNGFIYKYNLKFIDVNLNKVR